MTRQEAEQLATIVRASTGLEAVVEKVDSRFAVVVTKQVHGRGDAVYTLRDQADWEWLRGQIRSAFKCPVCGYPGLSEEPWGPTGDQPSYEICPSCGTEFGYQDFATDLTKRRERHRVLRAEWIRAGRPRDDFESYKTPAELEWDPTQELELD